MTSVFIKSCILIYFYFNKIAHGFKTILVSLHMLFSNLLPVGLICQWCKYHKLHYIQPFSIEQL